MEAVEDELAGDAGAVLGALADEPLDAAVSRAVARCRAGAVEEAQRILNAAWGRETERIALAGSEVQA